jgi:hypothetical protein
MWSVPVDPVRYHQDQRSNLFSQTVCSITTPESDFHSVNGNQEYIFEIEQERRAAAIDARNAT